MMKYNNIEAVKSDSIRIYSGMVVEYPLGEEMVLNPMDIVPKFNGASVYGTNNSTAAYIIGGEYYVIPYIRSAMEIIRSYCRETSLYVPFSNGDVPKLEKSRWMNLREMARRSYREDYVADCIRMCDERGIGELDADILANCFKMPEQGVAVKHLYYETTCYPIMNGTCVDCTVIDNIGAFCTNNGRVVFTYRDGTTYVAKGYGILGALRRAGYRQRGLFVPFSNGEEIKDPILRSQWDSLKKF